MCNAEVSADGIYPESLYYPEVFVWIPTLLSDKPLFCKEPHCEQTHQKLSVKGFNDNPIHGTLFHLMAATIFSLSELNVLIKRVVVENLGTCMIQLF